mgnify:CR=1 FL=1
MCGGTDFDRAIIDSIVKPWIQSKFSLPEDFMAQTKYKKLMRVAAWGAEKAKISLSSKDDAIISVTETELNVQDENGDEIYLDIPMCPQFLNHYNLNHYNLRLS